MSRRIPITAAVADAELAHAVTEWLAVRRRCGSVVLLSRRPWEYATSALLELVVAATAEGDQYRFVLKHLGPGQASAQAQRAKPSFVVNPSREIEVYRRILSPAGVGASLVGSRIDPASECYWLLVEFVPGLRLFEAGDRDAWTATARWLGALHTRLATIDTARLRGVPLIECDRSWYRVWIERALRFFAVEGPSGSLHGSKAIRWLADRYDRVIDRLLTLPRSLVHGEFYPSNVIVTGTAPALVPCPIDWETASVGPGILDLAALTAGNWSELDRAEMTAAYLEGSGARTTLADLSETMRYAQIHLAVQWLGWFGRRRAPPLQARDWLSDAVEQAEALRL